ncbi:MAG: RHS repeat-associated core domain-containing protein [Acidimicrobiales bacterium]
MDPSGLVFLINRYYDPSLRQFISVDPAYSPTHQLYGYANETPVNGSDPSGLGVWRDLCVASSPLRALTGGCPSSSPRGGRFGFQNGIRNPIRKYYNCLGTNHRHQPPPELAGAVGAILDP